MSAAARCTAVVTAAKALKTFVHEHDDPHVDPKAGLEVGAQLGRLDLALCTACQRAKLSMPEFNRKLGEHATVFGFSKLPVLYVFSVTSTPSPKPAMDFKEGLEWFNARMEAARTAERYPYLCPSPEWDQAMDQLVAVAEANISRATECSSEGDVEFRRAADTLDNLKQQFLNLSGPIVSCAMATDLDDISFPNGWSAETEEKSHPGSMAWHGINAPDQAIWVNDSTPTELRALSVEVVSEDGRHTARFVKSRNYGFHFFDPREREGDSVSDRYTRAHEQRDRFTVVATAAGNTLRSLPLHRLNWADLRTALARNGSPDCLWLKVVFDLAWQSRPGSGLVAKQQRRFCAGGMTLDVEYGATSESLRRSIERWHTRNPTPFALYRQLLDFYGDVLPDFYSSRLDDIASASALGAGMLADDLRKLVSEAPNTQTIPAIAPLSRSAAAAMKLIRAKKGKGLQGKEIVKALNKAGFEFGEPYFRKHIVPELKLHGVENHPSRGGYYFDQIKQ